jgi:hypothetical protein
MGGNTSKKILGKEGSKFTSRAARGFKAGGTGEGTVAGALRLQAEEEKRRLTPPLTDAAKDELLKRALIDRIRGQITRTGRPTVRTGPQGVTTSAALLRRQLGGR